MKSIITFKLSEELKEELIQRAKDNERKVSEICRLLIKQYLKGERNV